MLNFSQPSLRVKGCITFLNAFISLKCGSVFSLLHVSHQRLSVKKKLDSHSKGFVFTEISGLSTIFILSFLDATEKKTGLSLFLSPSSIRKGRHLSHTQVWDLPKLWAQLIPLWAGRKNSSWIGFSTDIFLKNVPFLIDALEDIYIWLLWIV